MVPINIHSYAGQHPNSAVIDLIRQSNVVAEEFDPLDTATVGFVEKKYLSPVIWVNAVRERRITFTTNCRERDEQPTAFGVDGIAIALSFRTSVLPASA